MARPILWATLTASIVILSSVGVTFAADAPVATVPVGDSPAVVAVDPVSHNVFVGNYYGDSVSVIDGVTRSSVATIPMPTGGSIAVPLSAVVDVLSGKAYIGNFWSNYVSAIDASTLSVVATISPPYSHASGIRALAADPSGATPKVYAAILGKNIVSVIDGTTDTVVKNIPVGDSPRAIAVFDSGSRRRVYVANRYSDNVSIIDGNTDSVIATAPTGAGPKIIAVDPDRGYAYVTSPASDTVTVIGADDKVAATIPVGDNPIGVAVEPTGRRVFVANYASNSVSVIDADALSVVATVATGVQPMAIAVDRSSRKVYVSCYGSSEVTMIDSSLAATSIATGYRPYALAVDEGLASHQVYSANWGANNVTVIDPSGGSAGPLSVTIDPMSGDTTSSTSPAFSGSASSSRAPMHSNIVAVFYRTDSHQAWQRAQIVDGAGTPSVKWRVTPSTPLSQATHSIQVAAMDQALVVSSSSDQGAGSDSAALGGGATYQFAVGPMQANHDWYVDASAGSDANPGTSQASAFKSVTRATLAAAAGDTIHVAAGLYGTATTGEVFPLHMFGGTLQGAGSGSVTLLGDGIDPVIQAIGVGSAAKIDGFTITGGSPGVDAVGSALTISNNVISGNAGGETGGGIHSLSGNVYIHNNVIRGNTATYGGGIVIENADSSRIESNTIEHNAATQGGGGIDLYLNAHPTISHNVIRNNSAHIGGGVLSESGSLPRITETVIVGNAADPTAGGKGGAIACFSGSVVLENDLITGNTSSDYAISGINSAATRIVNCTIAANGPAGIGRFSNSWPFSVTIANSILLNTGPEIDLGTVATILSSDVEGGYPGAGNIDADPKFVDPAADYHLMAGSPCIDAGTVETSITVDLDGLTRPVGNGWDMGAYEFARGPAPSTFGMPPLALVVTRFEQDDPRLSYAGSWAQSPSASFSGGTYRILAGAGRVDASFIGSAVSLIARTGNKFGIAKVTLDNDAPVLVDLYSANTVYKTSVWRRAGLAGGTHTLRVEFTGTRNAASASSVIDVDAIDISGTLGALLQAPSPTRFEQDDPRLSYAGSWAQSPSASFSGGTYRIFPGPGRVDASFTGASVELIARTGNKFGIAMVTIDNDTPVPVDLYSATTVYRALVWRKTGLVGGPHALRVEFTGTRNAASTSSAINVDALDIYGAPGALLQAFEPTRFEQDDARLSYAGSWAQSPSPSFSGGTYRILAGPGRVDASFTGSSVELIARTGNKFGIAKVTIDNERPEFVDLYSATTVYQALVWRKARLGGGTHTLRVEFTGTRNPASTSSVIDVDALDIVGTLTQAP